MKRITKLLSLLLLAALAVGCGTNGGENGPTDAPDAEITPAPFSEEEALKKDETDWASLKLLSEEMDWTAPGKEANTVSEAVTWVANELVLNSAEKYTRPYTDVDVDLILTNGTDTYTVPGFWDGQKVWRVRFVCPKAGTWTYKTVCTNENDAGLHNVTGTVECKEYTGSLPVYQHGFVTTKAGKKYFTYDDGTPFFYLGDTHWSFGSEPSDLVQKAVKTRIAQGFTVWQSEPLGASFSMRDGITSSDITGFRKFDEKFRMVADAGLTHANAEFFFPSEMILFINANGGFSEKEIEKSIHMGAVPEAVTVYDLADETKDALKRMCRYWVARYSAYPVMWTLGQEIDNDFYWNRDDYSDHREWSFANNPYKLAAEYIGELDPYKHPLSGHQEGASNTACSESAFRDVAAHDWYAAQWSNDYSREIDTRVPEDFWNNGQGKPAVDYEGRYCFLWTKNFGARIQGYMAYLNGMYGYGWGGQDTWCYLSSYSEDSDTRDGVDIVTAEDKKKATWDDSFTYDSVKQVGYMRAFMEKTVNNWYELVPRFKDEKYFTRAAQDVLPIVASTEDNGKMLIYFYQTSDNSLCEFPNATEDAARLTGTIGSLTPGASYAAVWFSPVTGEKVSAKSFVASADGTWEIGEKALTDMLLYVYKL